MRPPLRFHFLCSARLPWIRMSRMPGSARVEVSPSSSAVPVATFLRMRRMILPLRVLAAIAKAIGIVAVLVTEWVEINEKPAHG